MMTPKEKAEDLINKMFGLDLEDLTKFDYIDHIAAKHFALIAVNEILNHHSQEQNLYKIDTYYWLEVKKELENK